MTFDIRTDEFHVMNLCGTLFYIDADTRREVEHFLKRSERNLDTLTVSDIGGAEVLVIANGVSVIYSCTPETRAADRAMRKALDAEDL